MGVVSYIIVVGIAAFAAAMLGILWRRNKRRRVREQRAMRAMLNRVAVSEVAERLGPDQRPEPGCVAEDASTKRPSRSLKITLTEIGHLDNACPNCGVVLSERPGRKTKCPHCGGFIFVRTRPFDRQRVLVTEEQARLLEAEWSSFPRGRITPMLNQEEMEKLRPLLAEKFSKPPSDRDIAWAYLNQKTLDHAKHRRWGLYRNTRLSMAAVLDDEGKLEAALGYYLDVCYLDLNGPQNRGQIVTNGKSKVAPGHDFLLEDAFLAPAVVAKITEIILALKLNEHQVRNDFMHFAKREMHGLKPPVSPERAWEKLSAELYL
jgi:uncharacterized Zn finger protein (UPF0148 family)